VTREGLDRAQASPIQYIPGNTTRSKTGIETCLRFADDCLRIAEKMSGKDRQTLFKIAEAWRSRATQSAASQISSINL
jgi:hypothetical protein